MNQNDRFFASNVRRAIYKIMNRCQDTARDIDRAKSDRHSDLDHLRALEKKFDRYGVLLNNLLLSMKLSVGMFSTRSPQWELTYNSRLLLQMSQRLNEDGRIPLYQQSRRQSGAAPATTADSIGPLQLSYESDLQLDWPISKGDTTALGRIFDRESDDVEASLSQDSHILQSSQTLSHARFSLRIIVITSDITLGR